MKKIAIVAAVSLPFTALAIVSGSIAIYNTDEADQPSPTTTINTSDGNGLSNGWVTLGYVRDWDGTSPLTGTQIKSNWTSVGTIPTGQQESYSAYGELENNGLFAGANWTVSDLDLGDKRLVVLVGNNTSIADATEIAALTFSAGNATALTWSNVQDEDQLYIDFSTPSISNSSDFALAAVFGTYTGSNDLALAAIPEPSMFGLLTGLSALALAGSRRRRK